MLRLLRQVLIVVAGLSWMAAGLFTYRKESALTAVLGIIFAFLGGALFARQALALRALSVVAFPLLVAGLALLGMATGVDRVTVYAYLITVLLTWSAYLLAWRTGELKRQDKARTPAKPV